jgi:peptidoglycan-associated lipoprotein
VCDANKCVPKPECTSDGACGTGKKCSKGKCIVAEAPREEGTCVRNDDCPSGEECKEGRCASKSVSTCDFSPIRFDFNASDLSGDAQSRLQKVADCIKKQNLRFTLEGHADDRGTEEYNLQLSNRRAASAKRYLATLGVGEAALVTVGYGENKPAVNGQSEEAWAANRRVEFKPR